MCLQTVAEVRYKSVCLLSDLILFVIYDTALVRSEERVSVEWICSQTQCEIVLFLIAEKSKAIVASVTKNFTAFITSPKFHPKHCRHFL